MKQNCESNNNRGWNKKKLILLCVARIVWDKFQENLETYMYVVCVFCVCMCLFIRKTFEEDKNKTNRTPPIVLMYVYTKEYCTEVS